MTNRLVPKYKYTCTECGFVRYGDLFLSMQRCNGCKAVKFGLQKREPLPYPYNIPEIAK